VKKLSFTSGVNSIFSQRRTLTMLQNFRSYDLAVDVYRQIKTIKAPSHLRDQLLRASSSIVLNLSEGSAKPTWPDKSRFYAIAFGSLRETQSIIDLLDDDQCNAGLADKLDHLAACLYKLTYRDRRR
jgi:four helix bundle protein